MSDKIEIADGFVSDLPPLEIDQEESQFLNQSEPKLSDSAGQEDFETITVTPDQVGNVLRWGYKAGAWKTGYSDIWAVEDDEINEIAIRITPDINKIPLVAKAVSEADMKSGWIMLVYSLGSRVLKSIRRKKEEQLKALEDGEDGANTSTGYTT